MLSVLFGLYTSKCQGVRVLLSGLLQVGPHSSRTVRFVGEDACTAPNCKVKLHNLGIQSRDTHMMSVAQLLQQQQHSSSSTAAAAQQRRRRRRTRRSTARSTSNVAFPRLHYKIPWSSLEEGLSGLSHEKKRNVHVDHLSHKTETHHDERSTTTVYSSTAAAAQQRRRRRRTRRSTARSTSNVPFLVCITKFHGAASTPWSCECTNKG